MYTQEFIQAIRSKNKVRLTFFSKEDNRELTRLCAPMDFGPSMRALNKEDRFHFWDFESDKKNHVLSILPEQISDLIVEIEIFDPKEFVTWKPIKWHVPRDWGVYSGTLHSTVGV